MGDIVVHLATAMICFLGQCHPAILGRATPLGTYPLSWHKTDQAGYGGDILVYHNDASGLLAIHRVWLLRPQQQRLERLEYGSAAQRRWVSDGCINVMPDVYDQLVACCYRGRVTIEEN